MERRELGRTKLKVTRLGYGAGELRGPHISRGRAITEAQAGRILGAVMDSGINFIDTSYDYGPSEEWIGRYLGARREHCFIATKCGCTVTDRGDNDEASHLWTGQNLLHNIETSLRRLRTDYVDLWQLHNPSPDQVKANDLLHVMEKVKAAGKARWIGISTTLPEAETFLEWGAFDAFQLPYSALERMHEQFVTEVARAGVGAIIRGGVARGEPGVSGGMPQHWDKFERARLDELREEGQSRTAFLLRYTLSHPDTHTTIVATLNPDHLQENLKAAKQGPLPPEIYKEANRRLALVE